MAFFFQLKKGERMQLNTPIVSAMEASYGKEQYDAQVKKVLSDKQILAWILKYTTAEFHDISIVEIIEAIEGTPEVGTIPVNPGLRNNLHQDIQNTENITGMPNEDNVPNEGKVMFDIRFYAITRGRERVKLIINVEAQKDYYPGYDLVTRGIFYCARMLSGQLDTEFTAKNYDDVKKVYSIWICMNAPDYAADTITEYKMTQENLIGDYAGKSRYDLLSVVMVRLGKPESDEKTPKLQRLLYTLLSGSVKLKEKCKILNEEFGIQTMQEMEGANLMCNLSDWVEEQGKMAGKKEQLLEKIRIKLAKGKSVEEIADALEEDISTIQELIQELEKTEN